MNRGSGTGPSALWLCLAALALASGLFRLTCAVGQDDGVGGTLPPSSATVRPVDGASGGPPRGVLAGLAVAGAVGTLLGLAVAVGAHLRACQTRGEFLALQHRSGKSLEQSAQAQARVSDLQGRLAQREAELESLRGHLRQREDAPRRSAEEAASEERLPVAALPTDTTSTSHDPLDNREWLGLVEECVALFEDLDRHRDSMQAGGREVADHACLRLVEILQRRGVEIVEGDETFVRGRHQPVGRGEPPVEGQGIAETLSPGFVVGRRVLRRARVTLDDQRKRKE